MKILIHGDGTMGQIVHKLAQEQGFQSEIGVDFFEQQGDVIIDFSHFSRIDSVLQFALKTHTPLVIATTGYDETQYQNILSASNTIPILLASNTSLGVNLMHEVLEQIVPILAPYYDIEIIEKHHNKKVDSPSGTAKSLAETIIKSSPKNLDPIYGREGNQSKRQNNEIGIHAVRGGTVVGDHQIGFYGEDEIIELNHTALSKNIFAKGAIIAAQFLSQQNPGYYTMKDIFKGEKNGK